MKIAVASDHGLVSAHFGHCAEFALFTIGLKDVILEKVIILSPQHERGYLPGYLARLGVTHVIAGGMGHLARRLFADLRIITIVGASGEVDGVVEAFLVNRLVVSENFCPNVHTCSGESNSVPGEKKCSLKLIHCNSAKSPSRKKANSKMMLVRP